MEAGTIAITPSAIEAKQLPGKPGRTSQTGGAQGGFTQIFRQIAGNANQRTMGGVSAEGGEESGAVINLAGLDLEADAVAEVLPPGGIPAEESGDKKANQLAMLMAMVDMATGQVDYREFIMTSLDGTLPLDLMGIQEVGAIGAPGANLWMQFQSVTGQDPAAGMNDAAGDQALLTMFQEAFPNPMTQLQHLKASKGGLADSLSRATQRDMLLPFAQDEKDIPVTVLGYQRRTGDSAENSDMLLGQELFRQAVQEARGKLADKGAKTGGIPKDALLGEDAFRTQLNAQYAEALRQLGSANGVPGQAGIPEQIFVGLSKNLAAGKGEFVLKLEPEGLGEITVRLLARDGRTTLRIITTSAETARLINNDIHALQNALKPIQVEVREAVSETSENKGAGAYFSGFDQFSQQNSYNQYEGTGQQAEYVRFGEDEQGRFISGDPGGVTQGADALYVSDADLDMYV